MTSITAEAELAQRVKELEAVNARTLRALQRAKSKEADLVEAVHQAAYDAAVAVGKAGPIPRPARDRRRSPEVALLHLTDLQLGKVTHSYDSQVCIERVKRAVQKTIRLTEIGRADHPVREIVLALGGDLIENVSIFPGQPFLVDSTAFTQVFAAADLIESVVLTLLENFEKVTVAEVAGNHGRIGRKGDSPRGDNLDRIVGKIARERLAGQGRLEWEDNEDWFSVIQIGGYRCLLVHGDQIKSFGGNTPAFGIMRKATAWASGGLKEPFHDVLLGHFHTPMLLTMPNGGNVRVTGSPESDNEYAAEFVAARGRPSQRLMFVDPDKARVTSDYILWLDE